jgi:peroxiredoxin
MSLLSVVGLTSITQMRGQKAIDLKDKPAKFSKYSGFNLPLTQNMSTWRIKMIGIANKICLGFLLMAIALQIRAQSIPDSSEKVAPLLVGAPIPAIVFRKLDESPFDLRKAAAEKPMIIIFYRGGWCPFCNVHLGQLQKIQSDLIKLGYQLIAVSPDRPEKLRSTAEKQNLHYTLVSDSEAEGMKGFGIAFRVNDQTFDRYKNELEIDLENYSGSKHHILPAPAVFIVGKNGKILFQYVNPDFKVRLHPEILLAAAKAYANL